MPLKLARQPLKGRGTCFTACNVDTILYYKSRLEIFTFLLKEHFLCLYIGILTKQKICQNDQYSVNEIWIVLIEKQLIVCLYYDVNYCRHNIGHSILNTIYKTPKTNMEISKMELWTLFAWFPSCLSQD